MKTQLLASCIMIIASVLLNIVCGKIIIGFSYDVTSYILGGANMLGYFILIDILKTKNE